MSAETEVGDASIIERATQVSVRLITRKREVEQKLREAKRYEEFQDEMGRWDDLRGALGDARAAEELVKIAQRFGLDGPAESGRGLRAPQRGCPTIRGAVRTRGRGMLPGASLTRQLDAVAEAFRRKQA